MPSGSTLSFRWLAAMLAAFAGICSFSATATAQLDVDVLEEEAIRQAVAFASTSVVQIETIGGLEQVGGKSVPTAPTSGVVVGAEGWIVSSTFSFRQQPASILVRMPDGSRLPARWVARDNQRELVLLKIEAPSAMLPIAAAPLSDIRIGQTSIAIGKSFDPATASQSVGIVSAIGRVWGKAIQTDARISPYNYGGPLIDLQGRCLGILAPMNPGDGSDEDGSQWYDSGIGFAVPIDQVLSRLEKWKQGEDLFPGKLGVTLTERDDYRGPVIVRGTASSSPAAKGGLKKGDRIVQANDRPVAMISHLKLVLGSMDAGEQLRLKVDRQGELIDMTCELVKEIPPYRPPFFGIIPSQLPSGKIAIAAVLPGTPAEKSGATAGQVIEQLDGTSIASLRQLRDSLAAHPISDPITIRLSTPQNTPPGDNSPPADAAPFVDLQWTGVVWPTDPVVKLPEENIAAPAQPNPGTGVVEIPLGDVKNKSFAFVPPTYDASVPHGLLILLPEPGEFDQRKLLDVWEPLCRQNRWILAVMGSGNPQGWSSGEAELVQRVLTLLEGKFTLDSGRIVAGGIRSGGTLAALVALSNREKFSGLMVVESNLTSRLRIEAGQPLESLKILMVGSSADLAQTADKLTQLGHPSSFIKTAEGNSSPFEGNDRLTIFSWLRGLERL